MKKRCKKVLVIIVVFLIFGITFIIFEAKNAERVMRVVSFRSVDLSFYDNASQLLESNVVYSMNIYDNRFVVIYRGEVNIDFNKQKTYAYNIFNKSVADFMTINIHNVRIKHLSKEKYEALMAAHNSSDLQLIDSKKTFDIDEFLDEIVRHKECNLFFVTDKLYKEDNDDNALILDEFF